MSYFPFFIDLEKKTVLVVGGGNTALRKTKILLSFGANVKAVSPEFIPEFCSIAENSDNITLINRQFIPQDIDGIFVAVSATDNHDANKTVSILCQEKNIPVNVVDDISLCTFIFPSVIKEDDVVIGISSSGKSPVLTQYLNNSIKDILPSSLGEINSKMGHIREDVINKYPESKRKSVFKKVLSLLLKNNRYTKEELLNLLEKDSDRND